MVLCFCLRDICLVTKNQIMRSTAKFFLAFILGLLLISCSSDDDGGVSNAVDGKLTATVAGKSYTSFPEATLAEVNTSAGFEVITISGGSVDSENIQITIIGFEGVGSYNLNAMSSGTYSFLTNKSDFNSVQIYSTAGGVTTSGEIKISEYKEGERVKGTFKFTGYLLSDTSKKVEFSDGEFNITIKN